MGEKFKVGILVDPRKYTSNNTTSKVDHVMVRVFNVMIA